MAKQNTAQSFWYPLDTLKPPADTSAYSAGTALLFEVPITIAVHLTFPIFRFSFSFYIICSCAAECFSFFVTFCGCDYFWVSLLLLTLLSSGLSILAGIRLNWITDLFELNVGQSMWMDKCTWDPMSRSSTQFSTSLIAYRCWHPISRTYYSILSCYHQMKRSCTAHLESCLN